MARRALSRWALRLALREWRQRILIVLLIAVASAATLLGIAVASATPGTPNAHSVAADPVMNQVYVPIPSNATGGLCTAAGGNSANGCIAVFVATFQSSTRPSFWPPALATSLVPSSDSE